MEKIQKIHYLNCEKENRCQYLRVVFCKASPDSDFLPKRLQASEIDKSQGFFKAVFEAEFLPHSQWKKCLLSQKVDEIFNSEAPQTFSNFFSLIN